MRLIFMYGLPATGKLTVAQELAQMTGYRLFHNHLAVDLLLSVFDFGSEPFVALREEIWLSVFEQACRSGLVGLIFTFNPENTVRRGFVDAVVKTIAGHDGEVSFVEVVCPLEELKRRIGAPSRQEYRKLSSLSVFEKLHAEGVFDTSHMPEAMLRVDTSVCSAREAAEQIADGLGLSHLS